MSNAAVISIDFGSEWVKVALVKVSSRDYVWMSTQLANMYNLSCQILPYECILYFISLVFQWRL